MEPALPCHGPFRLGTGHLRRSHLKAACVDRVDVIAQRHCMLAHVVSIWSHCVWAQSYPGVLGGVSSCCRLSRGRPRRPTRRGFKSSEVLVLIVQTEAPWSDLAAEGGASQPHASRDLILWHRGVWEYPSVWSQHGPAGRGAVYAVKWWATMASP